MKRVTSYGVSVGGKPVLARRTRFYEDFAREFPDGTKFAITAEQSTRNSRQNRLMWFWNTIVGNERGWDKEYTHYLNKLNCNMVTTSRIDPRTGVVEDISYPGSTSELAVDAFAEFLERVQRYWAEEGIDLPSPNDEEYPATVEQLESRTDSAKGGRAAE